MTQNVAVRACWPIFAVTLFAALSVPMGSARADEAAGRVTLVVQKVAARQTADARPLAQADLVHPNETINTGPDSAATLSLTDGTELAIGAETEVSLKDYIYDAAANAGKFVLEITAGTMRFATGRMSKQSYEIRTPSVVTAVRGSIFAIFVTPAGSTYLATEEGIVEMTGRRGVQYTVPAGASLFFNTTGGADGALFDPLKGADLSGLPRGDGPTQAVREMDRLLTQAAANQDPTGLSPRALGLPFAVSQGLIDPADLPPFARRTPAYNRNQYDKGGYGGNRGSGGGQGGGQGGGYNSN